MTLTPGTRFGPYEVTAKLGEGGMGEVYRATDTKLRREVAREKGIAHRDLSIDGGARAVWSEDGSEIVYLGPSVNLSRAAVTPDGAGGLRLGTPEALFGTTLLADVRSFALAADGESLVLNDFGETHSQSLRLVVPWRVQP